MKRQDGFIILVTLFIAAVLTALLGGTLVRAAYQSQAARAAAAQAVTAAGAASALQALEQFLTGPLRDRLAQTVDLQASPSAAWYLSSLPNAAAQLQAAADALVCGFDPTLGADPDLTVTVRLHFTSLACGEPLPSGVRAPAPRVVRGDPNTGEQPLQEYAFPFVAVLTAQTRDGARATRVLEGEYRFELGTAPYSRWALHLLSTYRPDGQPGYLTSRAILAGPVQLDGLPFFWGRPWIGGPFGTAACDAVAPTLCQGTRTRSAGFAAEGVLPWNRMAPGPTAPCYPAGDCPTFAQGVDWNAAYLGLPPASQNPVQAQAEQPATWADAPTGVAFAGDLSRVQLSDGASPRSGAPAQILQVTPAGGGTRVLFVEAGAPTRLYLEARAGDNAILNPDFAVGRTGWVGISQVAQVGGAPTPNVGVLQIRDAYYGGWFPVAPGQQFVVGITARSSGPTAYRLQAGLVFEDAGGSRTWRGTAWGQTSPQWVTGDGTWQTVSATVTAPAGAVRARYWVQIDQPWNASDPATYYVTNAYLSPASGVAYTVPADPFTGVLYTRGSIQRLEGGGVALAEFAQLTLGAEREIRVATDLRYARPPCATIGQRVGEEVVPPECTDLAAQNLLGLYVHSGDVVLERGAAPDGVLEVHAAILARGGTLVAEGYADSGYLMEYVDLLGALTAQNAPMLGTWNAAGSRTAGFRDLRLVYDPRLQAGLAPPGWPRTGWAGVLTARAVLAGQGTDLR